MGVHLVNVLKGKYHFSPAVELIDGGTKGLELLPFFEGREKILIVDAVDFGKEPGHIQEIEDEDIPGVLSPKFSVHHIGLSDLLFALKLTEAMPEKICLIGIQPASTDIGLEMTGPVRSAFGRMTGLMIEKLKQWDVTCALQSP